MKASLFAQAAPPPILGSIAIVLLAVMLPPAASAAARPPNVDRLLAKAGALVEKGGCKRAVRELEKLGLPALEIRDYEDNARFVTGDSLEVRYTGEFPADIPRDQSVQALLYLAICTSRLGEPEAAAGFARAAVDTAQDPEQQLEAHNLLGLCTLIAQRTRREARLSDRSRAVLEEAEAAFKRVIEAGGELATYARDNLVEVLTLLGRAEDARTVHCPPGLEPLEVRGEVEPPRRVFAPDPQYTAEARSEKIQGVVILEAVIDKNGAVQCARVLKDLPLGLTDSAVRTVRRWRFEPATLDGRPVAVRFNLLVNYSLE